MNLLLLEADEVHSDTATLSGEQAEHVQKVLRTELGSRLRVGVIGGAIGSAKLFSLEPPTVGDFQWDSDAAHPTVDLVIALPRPKSLSRLLRSAASVGVRKIDLINAWKVDKSYLDSPRLQPSRMRDELLHGLRQGAHTFLPTVNLHRRFMAYIDTLPADDSRQRIVLHPRAAAYLESVAVQREAVLALGPDGGFTERELETLEAKGFAPSRLSDSVLRTDDAVMAALAQFELLTRMR